MGIKKMIIPLITLIHFSLVSFLQCEQIYHFKAPDYHVETTKDGFHKILIDGFFSYGVPGYPDVPSKIFRIAVPPDTDLNSIGLEYHEHGRISLGTFHIMELPPMVTWVDGKRIVGEKADVYSNNSDYPDKTIEHLGYSQMRKWKIINIKYTPFQYNPVTKNLTFVPEVTLIIRYSQARMRILSDTELEDSVMDRRAEEMLINYLEAKEWYKLTLEVQLPLETFNYIIITTNSIKTASTKLTYFTNYLTAKGYSVKVITETDFGSLTGQYPNNKAEKIREWLKNNYISMGIEYVLLIGSPSPYESGEGDVPMKFCFPYYDGSGPYYGWYVSPTDHFYADLTGNWDLNGDGYFGDYDNDRGAGGVDFTNEVYVGRIPVYSGVSSLDSVLSKIISYGNPSDISWRRTALLPMSFSDSTTDGAYLAEAMKSNYLSPADYSSWTMYMQGNFCTEADSSFSSDEELLDGAVKARWMNNPYGMVWWWGHGSKTEAALGYTECGWGTIMRASDAPSLNNNYPSFVYQCSCSNGYPEDSNNLGTALLYNGAIATVSASRVSWYGQGSWNTGWKYYCDNASIGYYYGQELVSNGKKAAVALYDVKGDMGVNGGWWGKQSWMNLFDFNLYGSPEAYIIVKYSIIFSASAGGTINPSPGEYIYPAGTDVTITATPDNYYRFSGWTGDVSSGHENDNPLTVDMDSDKSIAANFIRQYNLTIAAGSGGTTDSSPGTYTHDTGEAVTIRALPDSGYRFSGWTGDVPSGHEEDNPIAITMDSSKSITANFVRQYTLIIAAGTGGTTNPSPGTYTHDSGTQVSVTATANSGYQFSGWSGSASGTTNPITITMDNDKSVTANFTATSKPSEDGKKKDGCFIATAAYGSPLHPCVNILRDFRDKYLMPTKLGRMLVGLYYKYSPFVADLVAKNKALKTAVRLSLLPLVVFSYSMVHFGPIITAVILAFIFVLPIFLISFFRKKLRWMKAGNLRALASLLASLSSERTRRIKAWFKKRNNHRETPIIEKPGRGQEDIQNWT